MSSLDLTGLRPAGADLDLSGLLPADETLRTALDPSGLTALDGWGMEGVADSQAIPAPLSAGNAALAAQLATSAGGATAPSTDVQSDDSVGPHAAPAVQLAQTEPPTPIAPAALQALVRAGALTQAEAEEIAQTAQTMRAATASRLRWALGFSQEGRPIILDDNLSRTGLADELRAAGYNVRTVKEIFGREAHGLDDPPINSVAEQIDGLVVTGDRGRDPGGGFGQRAVQIDQRALSAPSIIRALRSKMGETP
jgi:hypothetical protein